MRPDPCEDLDDKKRECSRWSANETRVVQRRSKVCRLKTVSCNKNRNITWMVSISDMLADLHKFPHNMLKKREHDNREKTKEEVVLKTKEEVVLKVRELSTVQMF